MTEQQQATRTLSRRVVAKGAAWTLPALTVAAAAPAMAASGPPPTAAPGKGYKSPGESCKDFSKGYVIIFDITNNGSDLPILITSATILPGYTGNLTGVLAAINLPLTIPAGGTGTIILNALSANSANLAFSFDALIYWQHVPTDSHFHAPIEANVTVTGTPPDYDCPTKK
ncbi:MAG: hypothetical protein ACK5LS_07935 [Propioniciclava sp.]